MPTLPLLLDRLQAQRGFRFPWVPVMLGTGIGFYYLVPFEPSARVLWGLGVSAVLLAALGLWLRETWGPVWLALSLVLVGPVIGAWRTADVAAPVLPYRYYGEVEGRIVDIDRSASDKLRLTLDQVLIRRFLPHERPAYVRVSLHGDAENFSPEPGMVIRVVANMSPPDGPVEPGGFDFRRLAYFEGLGAVGYTRKPIEVLAEADRGWQLWLFRTRMAMSAAIQKGMPGPTGAFAAAMMTGDRSGMDETTTENLRVSNLAHLISISGLHMMLLTGTVFAALRFGLALVGPLRRRVDLKKLASVGALAAGAFYLALSGFQVPTERAFVMVSVALGAVFFGRRAISLRGLAIAALVILIARPESLAGPGFQMSFAATLALVVTFQWLNNRRLARLPKWSRGAVTLVVSSLVAGLATAPFAAATFNRISDYGFLANLASVPLISAIFMPAAILWCLLAPIGLGWIALGIMKPALWWVLKVAETVASQPEPVTLVVSPPAVVVPLIAIGGLWVALWQGPMRSRAAGVMPFLVGVLIWSQAVRPPLLIAADGPLAGVLTEDGRALNKGKGQSFVAETWLENDGDRVTQAEAADRWRSGDWDSYELGGVRIAVLTGKKRAALLDDACAAADLVVMSEPRPRGFKGPCLVYGKWQMADRGTIAIWPAPGGVRVEPTKGRSERPWD